MFIVRKSVKEALKLHYYDSKNILKLEPNVPKKKVTSESAKQKSNPENEFLKY